MNHFSCFTGIGGIDLAAEWAGFQTVGQVELADYPYQILCKHWPDVPKWRDIRDVTGESIRRLCGGQSPTLLSGGFPCQPFSIAGKQRGEEDDRFLWPELLRLVQESRPTWFIGENVPGIINLALDQAITDLESIGYTVRAFDIPACAIDAEHIRRRIFIVANDGSQRIQRSFKDAIPRESRVSRSKDCGSSPEWSRGSYVPTSGLCRSLHGLPSGVDRIKCLGNAVNPRQIFPILEGIAQIEKLT